MSPISGIQYTDISGPEPVHALVGYDMSRNALMMQPPQTVAPEVAMERRSSRNAAVLVALLFAADQAVAHTITYTFTGTVVNTNVIEGGSPFGSAHPRIGDSIVGTVTYSLDAPGTPFGFGENDVVLGISYASPSPPSKMTFTIRDLTVEATPGSDIGVTVGVDLPSNLEEISVDEVIFSMEAATPAPLQVNLRVEDTSRTALSGPDLPAWIPLERFDLRRFEVYQRQGDFAHLIVTGTVRTLTPVAQSAPIDIRPGRFPNRLDPRSNDLIPVAILTIPRSRDDVAFDALTVNPATVRFGPSGIEAAPVRFERRDVDGDADKDLLLIFKTADTETGCGTISGMLTGLTFKGRLVWGSDSIRTPKCPMN
jgi:hypothetical protein